MNANFVRNKVQHLLLVQAGNLVVLELLIFAFTFHFYVK
jgi:hypothetical protein